MKRASVWLFGLAVALVGCSNSSSATGGVEGDDVQCANGACDDALGDASGDTPDVASATDVALNDVAGSEVATPDAADAFFPDTAPPDVQTEDVAPDAVVDVPVTPDVGDDAMAPEDASTDVAATEVVALDIVQTEDVAVDVIPTEDILADISDALDDVGVAEDVAVSQDLLAEDAAADVADTPDAAALVDPWSTCGAATPTILYASTEWIQEFRIYGGNIYWTAYAPDFLAHSWVYGMPLTGVPVAGTPSVLADSVKTPSGLYQGLAVDANGLYFAGNGPGALYSTTFNADASTVPTQLTATQTNVLMTANQPRQVAVFNGIIYFHDDEFSPFTFPPGLRQLATLGGAVSLVDFTPKTAGYPTLNSAGLAFNATPAPADGIDGGIYFLPTGGNASKLLGQGAQVIGPDMDDNFAYWSQVGESKDGVWSAPLAGGAATRLTDLVGANVLAQDPTTGFVYFYASKFDGPFLKAAIFKVPKTGGQATAVVCDLPGAVWNIRTDATKVYFTMADGKAASWTLAPDTFASVAK